MHFHLPKPLHGWREFAGEVGIIVLGVLIALTAEQVAEELQWHAKIRRAEAAMRLELAEDDGPQAYSRLAIASCLDEQIARIHDSAGRVAPSQLRQWIVDYAPPFSTWDSEAWKAVVASDAGSHMGPDRLVQWSSSYRLMPTINEHNEQETQLAGELRDAIPPSGAPSGDDIRMVRRTAGQLRTLNRRIVRGSQLMIARAQKNGAPVPAAMRQALLGRARAVYGGCVRVPNLNATPEAQSLDARLRGPVSPR